MPGGKAVLVDLIKRERVPTRAAEKQTGVSGPRSETASRWWCRACSLAEQDSMGCSKVLGDSLHLGQVVGLSLSLDEWARR